jgi:YtkA-like protein
MSAIRNRRIASSSSAITRAIGAAVLLSVLTGCMMFAGTPKNLDYSRTRRSESGLYRGTILPQGDSIPQGRLQRWTLHLETADGAPVDSATVSVDGGMPQHGHGLPTSPRVTRALGNGDHLIEGVKFNMGGWWVVRFAITSSAGTDTVSFNLGL